jgi:dimethylargininase
MFTRAIVRTPAPNFAEGLTTAGLGRPDYELALRQHEAYCAALERCGLTLKRLEPDPNYPDSTFVEDVAILSKRCAVLTRPGAPCRRGEVESLRNVLAQFFPSLHEIESAGTVDGGDICQVAEHFFIGLSARTNEAGARQLSKMLEDVGYSTSIVDIGVRVPTSVGPSSAATNRPTKVGTLTPDSFGSLLHLKSGIAWLGDNRLAISDALAEHPEFIRFDLVRVDWAENYAANCVRVNEYVLIAKGFSKLQSNLQSLGYETIALEMSEFQKMDGGLSCLSLRF